MLSDATYEPRSVDGTGQHPQDGHGLCQPFEMNNLQLLESPARRSANPKQAEQVQDDHSSLHLSEFEIPPRSTSTPFANEHSTPQFHFGSGSTPLFHFGADCSTPLFHFDADSMEHTPIRPVNFNINSDTSRKAGLTPAVDSTPIKRGKKRRLQHRTKPVTGSSSTANTQESSYNDFKRLCGDETDPLNLLFKQ